MDQNNGRPRSAAMRERGRHDVTSVVPRACGRHCLCLNDIAGVEATAEEATDRSVSFGCAVILPDLT